MADNIYTSQSISGYNSSPPSDDGQQVASNEVEWDKHKSKLADPIKTLAEAIDSAMLSAGAKTINTDANQNNAIAGSLAFTSSELTIATGAVTATRSHHTIDTQNDDASDDLDTIGTGSVSDGCTLIIRAANTARTVVVKHEAGGAGQIHLADDLDYSLDDDEKSLTLQRRGADWYETGRDEVGNRITLGTEQDATNSGANDLTEVDFTGIPAGTKRITIMFEELSLSGTDDFLVQLGDAGGIEPTAYKSTAAFQGATPVLFSTGFGIKISVAARIAHGTMTLTLKDDSDFTWVSSHNVTMPAAPQHSMGAGYKALSAELTQVRITRDGTDTFDGGSINIAYE